MRSSIALVAAALWLTAGAQGASTAQAGPAQGPTSIGQTGSLAVELGAAEIAMKSHVLASGDLAGLSYQDPRDPSARSAAQQ